MDAIKITAGVLVSAMISGCASIGGASGPRGPKIVASGRATGYEQYAEVGVEFSSVSDFVALVSPSRWKSPVATGGSLSWVNPKAWSEDAGRTGRILLGEAVIVGGTIAAAGAVGSSDGGSDVIDPPPPVGPPSLPF